MSEISDYAQSVLSRTKEMSERITALKQQAEAIKAEARALGTEVTEWARRVTPEVPTENQAAFSAAIDGLIKSLTELGGETLQ